MKKIKGAFLLISLTSFLFLNLFNETYAAVSIELSDSVGADDFNVTNSSQEVLVFMQSDGKLAIGTTTPSATLHVVGPSTLSSAALKVNGTATVTGGNFGIGTTAPSSPLHVVGTTIVTDGNFGIGTTTPSSPLHVVGTATVAGGNFGIGTTTPSSSLHVVGTATVSTLQITGGSDLAEPFDIGGFHSASPGMVVCIDPQQTGKLFVSDKAYDSKVAGIISGAKGIKSGLTMMQKGSLADGALPVALTGRVYCMADASNGEIQPGDLLTTSNTMGHSMKVTDYTRAQGAIIGKAMSHLKQGKGMVLVLVSLQ